MHAITRKVTGSMAALLLAGCAAHKHAVPPLDETARAGIGPLSVETAAVAPTVPKAPPPAHSRGTAALKGAGGSVLVGLGAGLETRDPFGLMLFTALGIAVAPFVAAGAAVAAPQNTEVQAANAALSRAITRTQWDRAFEDAVEKVLAKQGRSAEEAPQADATRLKLTVEGPWLVLHGYTALPALTVHGELAKGGGCLIDRRWRWNGDSDHFIDLGENSAKGYRAQMEKGLGLLAEAVVTDIFSAAAPRQTAYRDAQAVARGGLPLLVTDAMDHQEQVGSWDKSEAEAAREPRCAGIGPVLPDPAPPPEADACRGFGCRNV